MIPYRFTKPPLGIDSRWRSVGKHVFEIRIVEVVGDDAVRLSV